MKDLSDLRIAFIAGMLAQGGCERQLYCMVKALCELGCHLTVFTFNVGEYWEAPLRELGISVVSIMERGRIARFRKLYYCIHQGNFDYVHSQHFYTNLYAVAVSLFRRTICIGSIRNDVYSEVRSNGIILGWLSLMLPPRLVANSYQGKANAIKLFRNSKDIFFLPNSVDTDVFSPDKAKKRQDYFKVVTVGTVWGPKRIDGVIEIASLLYKRTKGRIIFEIVGDGEQLEDMKNLARSAGLLDVIVFFKGRTNDVASVYRTADILLLTSDQEGTPNVVLEAMASGLPIISSSVGDVPRLVFNGVTGFAIEPGNIDEMAEKIFILSGDRELCIAMGERARACVVKNYSQGQLSDRLVELYSPVKTSEHFFKGYEK